jgi:hypothetical protein
MERRALLQWHTRTVLLVSALICNAALAQTPAPTPAPATPPAAAPATPPAEPKPKAWYEELTLNAFVSAGYLYNLNHPSNRLNVLRVFDAEDNTFSISVAEVALQKAVSAPSDVGFLVDLDFGGTISPRTVAFGDTPGNFDLRQGFASWIAPVGSGLRLDVGKFVTHTGYEVIDGYAGYNDNYSRSFLFNYAIPFTHTGAKVSYTFSPMLSAMVMVANGWDQVLAKQKGKMVGAEVALTLIEPLSIVLNYCGGSENIVPGTDKFRQLFDAVAIYKATSWLTIGLNGDYGIESGTSKTTPGADATWYGGAGYVRLDAPAGYGLAVRAEAFKDAGGTRLPVSTTVYEGTATAFYKLSSRFVMRAEFRLDASSDPIYTQNDGTLGKTQPTLAVNTLFAY